MRPPSPSRSILVTGPVAGLLALALAAAAGATGVLAPFQAPLEPPDAGGYELVERVLAKLSGHRRVLVVGAHPDDEDTTLLSLVARLPGGESAYLSLSRGEGGQNLIGPELGPALGLIRSRELLAARRIDGARQFFTRAYDFGYTRSLDETLTLWPREVLLEDTVRVIRRFRPQVLVSVFPPDERAGHGQHQAAGLITEAAFHAAGDAAVFPEMAAEGLPPWQPQALYRNTWWRGAEETTVRLPAGAPDPLTGRSAFQTAMASRSLHRSQDMGMLQPLGPQEARLGWVAGGDGGGGTAELGDGNLFRGLDTRLAAIAELLPAGGLAETVAEKLSLAEALAAGAREELSAVALARAVPALVHVVTLLREARSAAAGAEEVAAGGVHATALLDERIALAELGLAAAAGVAVDAFADRAAVAPGDAWQVETVVAAPPPGGGVPVDLVAVELVSPPERPLAAAAVELADRPASRFLPAADPLQGFHVRTFRAEVPAGAAPSVPYFLERPLAGALYDWSAAPPALHGEPFEPPPLTARFHLRIAGVELALDREVVHRERDQAIGEVRRPLRVVPAVEVAVAPELIVWPIDLDEPRRLAVTVVSRAARPLAGRVELAVPPGWPAVPPQPFSLAAAGAEGDRLAAEAAVELSFVLAPPPGLGPGAHLVRATAVVDGEAGALGLAVPVVDHPHIRPTPHPQPAAVAITAADIDLPPLARVGYVRGAADRVPELLAEVGVPIEVLDAATLAGGDLAVYDAIVVGSRAYETDPALVRANPRLLAYARGGGLVIVQYQQYQFVEGGFAPFALDIGRPHGRVTDEAAPVTALDPAHPVFHRPNEIGEGDWSGWVQERGLYFPATWDAAFVPLLEMADPGREAERGALLVAAVGEGTWVYTGLAFFRQLPAGVPGAFRLFANLLALESAEVVGGSR